MLNDRPPIGNCVGEVNLGLESSHAIGKELVELSEAILTACLSKLALCGETGWRSACLGAVPSLSLSEEHLRLRGLCSPGS